MSKKEAVRKQEEKNTIKTGEKAPGGGEGLGSWGLTPDVGLDGELVVGQALGRGPLDGEFGPGVGCVRVPSHQPAQAEISHLHQVVFPYQAVSGSKVSGKGKIHP